MAAPGYTNAGDYDKPDMPRPPLASAPGSTQQKSILGAWTIMKQDAANAYASNDDHSGSIVHVGSPVLSVDESHSNVHAALFTATAPADYLWNYWD